MDIFSCDIPNLRIKKYGPKRDPIAVIEATITLDAWDGYLVKRYENGKKIADGTIKLDFGGYNPDLSPDYEPHIRAYNYLLENQHRIRDNILRSVIDDVQRLIGYLEPGDPGVPNITPENRTNFDLRPFIGPQSLYFVDEDKDGVSYSSGCSTAPGTKNTAWP